MPIYLDNAAVAVGSSTNFESPQDAQKQAQPPGASSLVEAVGPSSSTALTKAANAEVVFAMAPHPAGAVHAAAAPGTELGSPSAPEIPYQQLARAEVPSGQQLSNVVSSLRLSDTEAYRILRQAGQKAFELDATISRAANQAVISAKLEQLTDLKAQIAGERKSATSQLAFSILGASAGIAAGAGGNLLRNSAPVQNAALDVDRRLASATLGAKPEAATKNVLQEFHDNWASAARRSAGAKPNGLNSSSPNGPTPNRPDPDAFDDLGHRQYAKYRQQKQDAGEDLSDDIKVAQDFFRSRQGDTSPARLHERLKHAPAGISSIGAGLDAGGQGIQTSITAACTAYDRNSGGAYEADQAKLAGKQDEVQVSLAQQVADAAKSGRDRSLKQIADSLDAVKEVAARYAAVVDKLT